jgi:hypothetical protein
LSEGEHVRHFFESLIAKPGLSRSVGNMMRSLSFLLFSSALVATCMAEISNTIVASGLLDPIEITIAPDGDLFVIEREGRLLRVHPDSEQVFLTVLF